MILSSRGLGLIFNLFFSGTVALCAGCNVYEAWAAVVVGAICGPLFLCCNWLLIHCQVSQVLLSKQTIKDINTATIERRKSYVTLHIVLHCKIYNDFTSFSLFLEGKLVLRENRQDNQKQVEVGTYFLQKKVLRRIVRCFQERM